MVESATDTTLEGYDPYSPAVRADPYPWMSQARERCPVHRHELSPDQAKATADNHFVAEPTSEFYSIFRYGDVVDVLQDYETFPNGQGPGPERMRQIIEGGMLQNGDPPHLIAQRKIVLQALTPRMIRSWEPRIREIANACLDEVAPAGAGDLVPPLAESVPGTVFAEILGVPPENRADFKRWTTEIVAALGGDDEQKARSVVAMQEFMTYFMGRIQQRRAELEQGRDTPDDLFTRLLTHDYEGRYFNDIEVILALQVLLVGGHETTVGAISTALWLLAGHPEVAQRLRDEPGLIPGAVEEILRLESPVQCLFRTAAGDQTVAGTTIPDNAKIAVLYASANRDPAVFADPDEFRVDRDPSQLRRHVAFGAGIHTCVGAALARAELRIVIELVLARLPGLHPEPEQEPRRNLSMITRGFASLPLRWDPAPEPTDPTGGS
ncbi:MAG TPA: cytochrome P450 [Pseudonocardia sp.]|nr:cytochrome P450 [Pseudonocardia sp.]